MRTMTHWLCTLLTCTACASAAQNPATPTTRSVDDRAHLFGLGRDHAAQGDNLRAEQ
jgi:hypothetical protein